jgi:hypothetical protein
MRHFIRLSLKTSADGLTSLAKPELVSAMPCPRPMLSVGAAGRKEQRPCSGRSRSIPRQTGNIRKGNLR